MDQLHPTPPTLALQKSLHALSAVLGVQVFWKDADDPLALAMPWEACTHQCAFCLSVKADPSRLARCQVQDGRHHLSLSDPHGRYRTCHAGVTDYIYPVRTNLRYLGSVFAGPWREDRMVLDSDISPGLWKSLPLLDQGQAAILEGLLEPLAISLVASRALTREGKGQESSGYRIRSTLDMIDRRYAEPLRASEAAQNCSWSVSRFLHAFKEETGISFSQRLLAVRLAKAKELLAATTLPIAEVAAASGFPTRTFFNRIFRRETGHSPRGYRCLTHP
jgi:AraC-like DNA-binding protein